MVERDPALRRELSLLDATMINVGTIVASAIFIVPSDVAQQLHATGPILLAWVVGGIVSLLGALAVAELAAALPEAGGQYAYLRTAYGPVWGFLYGWAAFAVVNTASIAAIAVGFGTYLGYFVPLGARAVQLVAVASIVALTAINCLGVRPGAVTQNVLTFLKLGALAAIVVVAAALPGGGVPHLEPLWPHQSAGSLAAPFGVAMLSVLWAYDGWIESTYVGSEIRDPERNLPRSIVLSVVVCGVLFLLVNAAYLYVLSPTAVARSPLVASDTMQALLGAPGASLVALTILLSTLGANNGIVLTSARIPYAMARQGLFFGWAGRVHPRFRTPVVALLAQGALAAGLTLTGTYTQLIRYVVFASFLFYALSCGAVMILRRRAPDLPRPYRTWGYPVTPVVFILFALWLVGNTIREAPRDAAIGAGLILLGLPGYFFWRTGGRAGGGAGGRELRDRRRR